MDCFHPYGRGIWNRGIEDGELYLIRPDGSEIRRITENEPILEAGPAWSPDREWIAYDAYHDTHERWKTDLYRIRLDGADSGQRITKLGRVTTPTWSPDGEWLAFGAPPSTLYRIRPDGSDLQQLGSWPDTSMGIGKPDWSPDGEWIVYFFDWELYLISSNGGEPTQILPSRPAGERRRNPVWAPDGDRIAFVAFTHAESVQIYSVRPDGTELQRITPLSFEECTPADVDWYSFSELPAE